MTTAVHPNAAKACLICGGGLRRLPETYMPALHAPICFIPLRFLNADSADMSRKTSDRNIKRIWTKFTGLAIRCLVVGRRPTFPTARLLAGKKS